jgi:hypothetical protein
MFDDPGLCTRSIEYFAEESVAKLQCHCNDFVPEVISINYFSLNQNLR